MREEPIKLQYFLPSTAPQSLPLQAPRRIVAALRCRSEQPAYPSRTSCPDNPVR